MSNATSIFSGSEPASDATPTSVIPPAADDASGVASEPLTPEAQAAKDVADAKQAKRDELSKLAKAEKAKWREKQALKAQRQQFQTRDAQREQELAHYRSVIDSAKRDPLGFVERHGATVEDIAGRVIAKGSPQEMVRQLQDQITQMRQEREDESRRARESTLAQRQSTAEKQFIDLVKDETKFEAINALYEPAEILARAKAVVRDAKERGMSDLSDEDIAHVLEERAKPRLEKVRRGKQHQSTDAQASPAKASASGPQATKAGTPRTLTNGHAAERGATPVPFDHLPEREQNRILADQLRKASG